MENDGRVVQVPLPADFSRDALKRDMDAALKRFSKGFLKTVALHTPPATPPMPQFGMMGSGKRFDFLRDKLGEEHAVVDADLKDGRVPADADFLLLASPENLNKKQLFAVDQFLMQGGTVAIATAPFDVALQGRLAPRKHTSGLEDWLAHHGITLEETMVLDEQNSAFPIPTERKVGMFTVRETQLVNYPYFVDIRTDGMDLDSGILAGISQLTMNWASPIVVDQEKNRDRRVIRLLRSSPRSWTSDSLNIQPDFRRYGKMGFQVGDKQESKLLGVVVEGVFTSWFKDKPNPILEESKDKKEKNEGENDKQDDKADTKQEEEKPVISRIVERSPESARIMLFSSNTFLTDVALGLTSSVLHTRYLAPVQLMNNCVDWSLEDQGLLAIRGRSHFARTLDPLDRKAQMFWEYCNYFLALLGLFLVWVVKRAVAARAAGRYERILATGRA